MELVGYLAAAVLAVLAALVGVRLATLHAPARAPHRFPLVGTGPLRRSDAWNAVVAVALTLVLVGPQRRLVDPWWLQVLLLTVVPLGLGLVYGRVAASRTPRRAA